MEVEATRPRGASWLDYLCLGGIVTTFAMSWLLLPFAPSLISHAVPNLLLTGSVSALLVGGSELHAHALSLPVVLGSGLVGLSGFDGFFFWAGRRYPDRIAAFIEKWTALSPAFVAKLEGRLQRIGPPLLTASYFLPFPTYLVILLLGASEVKWRWFVLADLIGSAAWCLLFIVIGYRFHSQVHHIAHYISHYSDIGTVILIVVIVVLSARRGRRQSLPPATSET